MIYPLVILFKNQDQINLINNQKNFKILYTNKKDGDVNVWQIGISEDTPSFTFTFNKNNKLSIITDLTTIDLKNNKWNDDYINIFFETVARVASQINGGISDINPNVKKPLGILNPFLIKDDNATPESIKDAEFHRNMLIDTVKDTIYNTNNKSIFMHIIESNPGKVPYAVMPIIYSFSDGKKYLLNHTPEIDLAPNLSIGRLIFQFMQIFHEFPSYEIIQIKSGRSFMNGVQKEILLVGLFVPFRYFSTNPEEKFYWTFKETVLN